MHPSSNKLQFGHCSCPYCIIGVLLICRQATQCYHVMELFASCSAIHPVCKHFLSHRDCISREVRHLMVYQFSSILFTP